MSDSEVLSVEQPQRMPVIVPKESQYTKMLTLAIEKDLDIEKLERFVALQKEWEAEQARKQYLLAHSRFQSDVPVIYKKGHADFGQGKPNYDYAKLEDIAEGIKPHLVTNGLSYSWSCSIENGIISVTCTMSHIDGSSKSSTMISTPDGTGNKSGIHSIASARSYLKRYTLLDVAGVTVAGEDDDAQEASKQAEPVGYPEELFKSNFPKWEAAIKSNRISKKQVIGKASEKGALTQRQMNEINSI